MELAGRPDAPARPRPSTGLFHLAILVPSRAELARALRRVLDAGASFTGASDHLVSEALYLDDPEGNGIEIYRDRPREEWTRDGGGELRMDTLPLDVEGVLAEMPGAARRGHARGRRRWATCTCRCATSRRPRRSTSGVLGFEPTVRGYPGALFVSAGGYHHHVGLNTWGTAGRARAARGRARARPRSRSSCRAPRSVAAIEERARAAGDEPVRQDGGALLLRDPSGNRVLVRH